MAHALVDWGQPPFPGAVNLDDAQQLVRACGQCFHREGAPALFRLFRARQNPVADGERRPAPFLNHPQARRGAAIVGLPNIGHRNCLTFVHVHNPQDGHPGNPAHAMKPAAVAVDQAFVCHVPQQRLQLDLFLPLEPECARNFPLACGNVGAGDEIEYLLASGKTGLMFWGAYHVELTVAANPGHYNNSPASAVARARPDH